MKKRRGRVKGGERGKTRPDFAGGALSHLACPGSERGFKFAATRDSMESVFPSPMSSAMMVCV